MPYVQRFSNAAAAPSVQEEAANALARLMALHRSGSGPRFLAQPALAVDRSELERAAGSLRAGFRHLVVIGTGGSSLGAQAIAAALAPGSSAEGRRLSFLDNVDPAATKRLLDGLALEETAFLAISKSGNTAETMALALAALGRVEARVPAGEAGRQFRFIVEPGDSPLRRLAARLGVVPIDHDPKLGGRFSVLSAVGLLPALFLGLDGWALRAGAAEVLEAASSQPAPAPAEGAAHLVALSRAQGVGTLVLMNYCDALDGLGLWWRQLVGESLGKAGQGFTPVTARGTADQHSQLQLYLAGPADKSYAIIGPPAAPGVGAFQPGLAAALGIPYLEGQTLGALFAAEAEATARTLAEAGRPVRRFDLDVLDARTLGGLFMHFMLEVVLMADLLGIDPYDQPAVEQGKRLVRELLGEKAP